MIPGSEPTQRNLAHLAAFRERAMPLFNSQHQNHRGIRWRGMAATAMVELLVLFALAFAVVRYVEWSSAGNFAEFMSATKPSASVANHSGEFSTPAQGPQGASRLRSEREEPSTASKGDSCAAANGIATRSLDRRTPAAPAGSPAPALPQVYG